MRRSVHCGESRGKCCWWRVGRCLVCEVDLVGDLAKAGGVEVGSLENFGRKPRESVVDV
jgi:hypothetical protein